MAEVLNKRSDLVQASGIPTVPLASQMKYGELALNYANGAETMFIKNSNDNIVSFSNDNAIIGYVDSNLANYYTKLLSGNAKIFSGTCSTAAATTTKVVTCTEFTSEDLVKGALIFVTFSATNSGATSSLKMDVNGTGVKPLKKVYAANTPADLTSAGELRANQTYLFSYDGTNWVCITLDYNSNTTYTIISDSELRAGTATDRRTVSAARLHANYNITGRTIRIGADTIDVPLDELSENYEMSPLESNIVLEEGDTYEEAFGKLEKAILNNELVTSHALNNLDLNIQTLILNKELLEQELINDELVISNALNNLNTNIELLEQELTNVPDDSNLVHKTGDETIGGDKTFTGTITGTDINGDLYGGVYSSYAELDDVKITPPIDGNVGTLTLVSVYDGDAQLIVGNSEGNTEGQTPEEQATGGWTQIYNSATDKTLLDELDERNNVQADWNQTTTTANDYIKNKPTIPQYVICTLNSYNAMASHDPDTYYIILANGEEV